MENSDKQGKALDSFRSISPCHEYHDPKIRVFLDSNEKQQVEAVLQNDNHWRWCDANGNLFSDEKLPCQQGCNREHVVDQSYQGSF